MSERNTRSANPPSQRGFGCVLCDNIVDPSRDDIAVWTPNEENPSGNDWICTRCILSILNLDTAEHFMEWMWQEEGKMLNFSSGRVGPIPIIDIMERGVERQIHMGDSLDVIESIMSLSLFSDDVVRNVGNAVSKIIIDRYGASSDPIHTIEDVLHRLGVDDDDE